MPYSLAFFKFKKSLEREIRNYWSIASAAEFSKYLLQGYDPHKRITEVASDNFPFKAVDIRCDDFISQIPIVVEYARENSVVNFITAFEVYLFEILSRIIYLDPNCMSESEMQFRAKDIVDGMNTANFKQWFSFRITDKNIRNKQHSEVIQKIASIAKCDIKPIMKQIEDWNKWTYVRNSVVHTGRKVSSDLSLAWNDRFPNIGSRLNIIDNEMMKVQSLAMTIAKHLDKRINDNVINNEDAFLLIRELFVRKGVVNVGQLKKTLQNNLNFRATDAQVERAISFQRKTNTPINEIDFDGFINEIEI